LPVPVDPLFALASTPPASGHPPAARAQGRVRARRSLWSMLAVVAVNVVLVGYVVVQSGMAPVGGEELALGNVGVTTVAPTGSAPSTSVAHPEASSTTAPAVPATTPPTRARGGVAPRVARTTAPSPGRTSAPRAAPPSTSAPTTAAPTAVAHVEPAPTTTVAPTVNIAPSPDFLRTCGSSGDNDATPCVDAVTTAIDNARSDLGLPSLQLPGNWDSLSAPEQLFVLTDLERTARGLVPLAGEVPVLDAAAASAAALGSDPTVPSGFPATGFASNWAGWIGNPLEAMYYWMYDDGLGSPNRDCTEADPGACWGHRQNILFSTGCDPCVMGGAWGTTARGNTSVTELIVATEVPQGADFTWAQEQTYLP